MKRVLLMAALLGGVSFSSMAAGKPANHHVSTGKSNKTAMAKTTALFKVDSYLFTGCGHQDYVCCLTPEGAAEYLEIFKAKYC